ncbi:MAG: hypothetical protein JXQ99_18840 [Hyphomicrobiaceae bacterium]
MIDAVQDFRISALERALASLTGGDVNSQPAPASPVASPTANAAATTHQDTRIAALEGAVLALSNSITLLNQQMTSLATELQKQTNAQNMITITPTTPTPSVDSAQDARLDGIDTLLQSLAQNVADYNNQMTTLITQYQSLHPKPNAKTNNFGLQTP